jgi:hypothetical protein
VNGGVVVNGEPAGRSGRPGGRTSHAATVAVRMNTAMVRHFIVYLANDRHQLPQRS